MRLILTTGRCGLFVGQSAGEIVDVPEAEARAMLAAGQADPYDDTTPAEDFLGNPPPATSLKKDPRRKTRGH